MSNPSLALPSRSDHAVDRGSTRQHTGGPSQRFRQPLLTPDGRELLEERASVLRNHTIPTMRAAVVDGYRHDWSLQPDLDRARAELVAIETTLWESSAIPAETDPWIVELGDAVTVEFPRHRGRRRVERFRIVHPLEAALDDERISTESPLARALLGRAIGESVSVEAPAGRYRVRILATRRPDSDAGDPPADRVP